MKRILFLIHDLGQGGAEKVLVNLVNNMDTNEYDITVMTLFDVGVNKQFLNEKIHYKTIFKKVFRGNSHIMKLLSPRMLHRLLIKDSYDVEVAFLEGPSARVISGCDLAKTKKVSWIHITQSTAKKAASSFRSVYEAETCYNSFNKIVFVSQGVRQAFINSLRIAVPTEVLYNVNDSETIKRLSMENVSECCFFEDEFKIICIGKLELTKGFDRVIRCVSRLRGEGYRIHAFFLGIGTKQAELLECAKANHVDDSVTFLGYHTNPYKFISRCDLFVCASYREGFSTATTEALIVGTPVCSTDVAGAREMLGEHNEYGIVTENNDESLYEGIKTLVSDQEKLSMYKTKAVERGKAFSKRESVRAIEKMFNEL